MMAPTATTATITTDTKPSAPTPSVEDRAAAALKLVNETKNAEDFLSNLPLIIECAEQCFAEAQKDYAHAAAEYKKWNDIQNTPHMETQTKDEYIRPHLNHWASESSRLRALTGNLERNVKNLRVLLDFQAKTA